MLKSPVEVVPAARADSCTAAGPRHSSFSVGDLLVNNHEQPWLDMAGYGWIPFQYIQSIWLPPLGFPDMTRLILVTSQVDHLCHPSAVRLSRTMFRCRFDDEKLGTTRVRLSGWPVACEKGPEKS